MSKRALRRAFWISLASLIAGLGVGCSSSPSTPGTGGSGGSTTASTGGGTTTSTGGAPDDGGTDAPPPPPSACEVLGLPARAFSDGPYGIHRREVADDFTLDLVGADPWHFKERWSGCESYVFLPDTLTVSALDTSSLWAQGVDKLLQKSPRNVHYFFVSRAKTDDAANTATAAMRASIDASLAALPQPDADHWRARLHVAQKRAATLGGWLQDVLSSGHGRIGFTIDRFQRVRGIGFFADVKQYDPALDQAMQWPWKSNLAYAAHEARFFNWEADAQAQLDAENATVVDLWKGEVLAEFAEADVDLPSAAEMASFDTLEVEIWQGCPNADEVEFNNCGAWDYIASLGVQDAAMNNVEIARFITSYHRETHWVVDVSPMLVLLKDGGKRHFRWDFAPSWNTQPTATRLSLRFSNKKKADRPAEATFLWAGGAFDSTYDPAHTPIDVPIPADAKRVEIWTIITGHGAETGQCSEFCNHQHQFKVNGVVHQKDHLEAGKQDKCIDHVDHGMIPNQAGTWWFGRGGWCPGQQVDPWAVDVTADVTPGQTATIEYQGLYKNLPPPDSAGNIAMVSYLVVYK